MKLYAISDLHLDHKINRDAFESLPSFPEDWLILGGDISPSLEVFRWSLNKMTNCFKKVIWVPGNHDLWTDPNETKGSGEEKYLKMVSICRNRGVITPEDPYPLWPGKGGPQYLVPLFLLYDYTFRPDSVSYKEAIKWAGEKGVFCTDEKYLDSTPYPSNSHWCHARCEYSKERINELSKGIPLILINHFPLRQDLIRLFLIPRFCIWCGTVITENWHKMAEVSTVVYGHLHMRATDYRDGVRFEEVSLGYPRNWKQANGIQHYLYQILPEIKVRSKMKNGGPYWRF